MGTSYARRPQEWRGGVGSLQGYHGTSEAATEPLGMQVLFVASRGFGHLRTAIVPSPQLLQDEAKPSAQPADEGKERGKKLENTCTDKVGTGHELAFMPHGHCCPADAHTGVVSTFRPLRS